jgi:NAD(P)-dependent dehydrogenase (short-subunit alcohol dehydrogenase family)
VGLESDRVVVVTGASRGAGKGIATALGATGAKVYVTGRTRSEADSPHPGTVFATAEEIARRGGIGVPVIVDHSDDEQVRALFDQVAEEDGRLDILVNNVLGLPDNMVGPEPFWKKSLSLVDLLDVGTRSSYVSSYYAGPLLEANGEGLVVNTSSYGGSCYMHGPAYGAGKAAIDKMAHDMAVDFEPFGVAVVSIWMGLLTTERSLAAFKEHPDLYGSLVDKTESPEFTGRVIDALANDRQLMKRSGQVLIGAEVAEELGVLDIDGRQPPSHRAMLGKPTVFSGAISF